MDDEINFLNLLSCGAMMAYIGAEEMQRSKRRKKARHGVSPYLKDRNEKGRFASDFEHLHMDSSRFIENFRMPPEIFDELFERLQPHLRPKKNTRPKDAAGTLQRHVASCYRISKQHIGKIVSDVCKAICCALKQEISEWTEATLREVADGFQKQWNFPNCVGAADGKHVAIKAPPNSGSLFYNYKGFHSIVLMATCDANYRFTYIDVGAYGSEGDSNVVKNSKFGSSVLNDECNFPPDTFIDEKKIPHFIVGDDAFPLCKRIIKPYGSKPLSTEERICNYRLSRARRCIENAFGILSSRWLCLRKVLICHPDRAQLVVSACCQLHNFLLNKSRQTYNPAMFSGFETSDGNWEAGQWHYGNQI
ncbi:putative nuclease HARBI1 [Eurosta solidaginis]|uniref:putative nuclease HARBI1 n=1 Tax=Eurosta solidaginis TaxID=178769 RepID=UPI0035317172